MLNVRTVENTDGVMGLISLRLKRTLGAVAEELADIYRFQLQANEAPPHSGKGEIPHAYFGHKDGGWGPQFEPNTPNNRPESGFSAVQTDFLATYIESGVDDLFDFPEAYVGFAPSHVTTRYQNYLLFHDENGRPWVMPIYNRNRDYLAEVAVKAARDAANDPMENSGGWDTPFG